MEKNCIYNDIGLLKEIGTETNKTAYANNGKSVNTLTWNNRGNITAQTKNGIVYSYEYDKKNQLKSEK